MSAKLAIMGGDARDDGSGAGAANVPLAETPVFRRLFEHSLDGMILADDQGRYYDVNSAACALLGYTREQLLRMGVADLIAASEPSAAERYACYIRLGRERGEFPFLRGDGKVRIAEYSAVRFGPDQNLSVLRDVTARKQMEQELRESEERFRQLAHSIYRVFWLISLDYQETLYVNPQHESVFGQPLAEVYADFRAWLAVVHPEDRAAVSLAIEQYRAQVCSVGETPSNLEIDYRIIKPDGKPAWLQTSLFPVRNQAGEVYRFGGLTRDVTNERQLTAKLAAAEQNIRALVESSLDGITVLKDQSMVFANRKMLSLLGASEPAAILGRLLREYVVAEDQVIFAAALRGFTASQGQSPPTRLRLLSPRGAPVEVEMTLVRVQFSESPAVMAVLHDMMDRARARVLAEAMVAERVTRLQIDAALQRARTLQAITDSLLAHSDETLLLSELAERTRALLAADCVAVYRVAEDATEPEEVAVLPAELKGLPWPPGLLRSWVWQGTDSSLPAIVSDAPTPLPSGLPATAIIRLTPHGGTAIGLLVVSLAAGRNLGDEDRQMLALIGERVGSAIERGRLYRRLQEGEARLRLLSRQIVETQERERQHIARELHDEIGQLLTALSLRLQHCCQQAPAALIPSITEAQSLSRDLLNRVRQISLSLRPLMLDNLGLLPALSWHLERVRKLTRLNVQLTHSGIERRFAPELEIAIYRVVQEAVTNIVRHTDVSEAIVRVWASSITIAVQIVDTGRGFDAPASLQRSAGLLGMQERVALLDGLLTIDSAVGMGTCITAEFPL